MNQLAKFSPVFKVDEATHTIYALATEQEPDCDNEVAEFFGTLESYKKWSKRQFDTTAASGQKPSLGNVRWQHTTEIAGKVIRVDPNQEKKQIWVEIVLIDNMMFARVMGGYVTGISHAGRYIRRWHQPCGTDIPAGNYCPTCGLSDVPIFYVPELVEISLVDRPALDSARFSLVRSDGSTELVKFAKKGDGVAKDEMECPHCGAEIEYDPDEDETECPECGRRVECKTAKAIKGATQMSLKANAIKLHKSLSASHRKLATGHRELAKAAEGEARFASARAQNTIAEQHDAMQRAYDSHVEALSGQAGASVDAAEDGQKVAKNFFNEFLYGEEPAVYKQSPSGGLFE
jgi:DNA-directed RNA polymerase subunit RPC12/RpoP